MALEFNFGLMEPNTKASGRTVKPQGMENLLMSTETFMTENGKKIRLVATEFICTTMGPDTKDSGSRTTNMVTASRSGSMAAVMTECIKKAKNMVMESIPGKTVVSMMVTGSTIKLQDMVNMSGPMEGDM